LRHDESLGEEEDDDHDPLGFTVLQDDSSRNVTKQDVECNGLAQQVPTSSEGALRLAINLAIDAGEYDRAAAILDVLKRTRAPGTVTALRSARERHS
jgi:hypothetical protein